MTVTNVLRFSTVKQNSYTELWRGYIISRENKKLKFFSGLRECEMHSIVWESISLSLVHLPENLCWHAEKQLDYCPGIIPNPIFLTLTVSPLHIGHITGFFIDYTSLIFLSCRLIFKCDGRNKKLYLLSREKKSDDKFFWNCHLQK